MAKIWLILLHKRSLTHGTLGIRVGSRAQQLFFIERLDLDGLFEDIMRIQDALPASGVLQPRKLVHIPYCFEYIIRFISPISSDKGVVHILRNQFLEHFYPPPPPSVISFTHRNCIKITLA